MMDKRYLVESGYDILPGGQRVYRSMGMSGVWINKSRDFCEYFLGNEEWIGNRRTHPSENGHFKKKIL